MLYYILQDLPADYIYLPNLYAWKWLAVEPKRLQVMILKLGLIAVTGLMVQEDIFVGVEAFHRVTAS